VEARSHGLYSKQPNKIKIENENVVANGGVDGCKLNHWSKTCAGCSSTYGDAQSSKRALAIIPSGIFRAVNGRSIFKIWFDVLNVSGET